MSRQQASGRGAIRRLDDADFAAIHAVVNEAAEAYRGVIPGDRWHQPYMDRGELRGEIDAGVVFWGAEEDGRLIGVMGLQEVAEVALIRHAYVRPRHQRQGTGGRLLAALCRKSRRPLLVGTWAAAGWAIRFYEKHGFRLLQPAEKDRLLRRYWSIPDRQIETSVVLADRRWPAAAGKAVGGEAARPGSRLGEGRP